MKHPSLYLDWYVRVPKLKYDLRSSGVGTFKYNVNLGEVDLSVNHALGNPETAQLLARRYHVAQENLFISTEGASGQNARVIRVLREKDPSKTEAIVEYPTYEPLLRHVQEHFPVVKRLERHESEDYRLDADRLRKVVSERTGLLMLTNPHLPSGDVSRANELKEVMNVAEERDFYVVCDEIYAEFNREALPTVFSIDRERGIVTTGFSKAYGLGGLKIGAAVASKELVNDFYEDTLSTVGVFSNIAEITMTKLLTDGYENMKGNQQKYVDLKNEAKKLLKEKGLEYVPNDFSITLWVKLPVEDTYRWTNEVTIPQHSLAVVPGTFFLFKDDYTLVRSSMVRLGVGALTPNVQALNEAFDVMLKAIQD